MVLPKKIILGQSCHHFYIPNPPFPCANHSMLHLLFHLCVGQRDEKNKKELVKPVVWPKPVYQGTAVFQMFYMYLGFIPRCLLSIQRIQKQVLKMVKNLNLQSRKSGPVHSHCYAEAEGTGGVK